MQDSPFLLSCRYKFVFQLLCGLLVVSQGLLLDLHLSREQGLDRILDLELCLQASLCGCIGNLMSLSVPQLHMQGKREIQALLLDLFHPIWPHQVLLLLLEYGKLKLGDLLCGLLELPALVLRLLDLKPLHLSVLVGLPVDLPVEVHQLLLHEVQGVFEFVCLQGRLMVIRGAVLTELSQGLCMGGVRGSLDEVPHVLGDRVKAVKCLEPVVFCMQGLGLQRLQILHGSI